VQAVESRVINMYQMLGNSQYPYMNTNALADIHFVFKITRV